MNLRSAFPAAILASALTAASAQVPAISPSTPPPPSTPHHLLPSEDWPNLQRYRDENAALPAPSAGEDRVVFMGDSITDNWGHTPSTFFPGKPYINRGISGQTTPQMLVRFQQDVIHLHPSVVVINAGTNDIAGNTGPSTPQMIEDNLTSMVQLAQANGIRVVLASITPAFDYPWRPKTFPTPTILTLNQWMQTFCLTHHCTYLDYYTSMADPKGVMLPGYASDGVHPTRQGYAIMAPLAEQAIATAKTAPTP
jgi:lysophospholipase L1-like esterase